MLAYKAIATVTLIYRRHIASPAGEEPRRAYISSIQHPQPEDPVLHVTWNGRSGRELPRQYGIRQTIQAQATGTVSGEELFISQFKKSTRFKSFNIFMPQRVAYINRHVRLSVRPSFFCLEHNFKTMQSINMKLHRQIDLIKEKCSAQEP